MISLRRLARRVLNRHQVAPVILMYHRIATMTWDPWRLAVAPQSFREQLAYLKQNRTVLRLSEFVTAHRDGRLPDDAAAITFDDGYRDNLVAAKPLLAQEGLPATLFLTTGFVGQRAPYWWDDIADRILGAEPQTQPFQVLGQSFRLGPREHGDLPSWSGLSAPKTARQTAYMQIVQLLRPLPPAVRAEALADLDAALPVTRLDETDHPMSSQELDALLDGDTFDLGAHTVNHPWLDDLSPDEQLREIADSVEWCRNATGQSVEGFAYPFGNRSATAVQAVNDCGLAWACAIQGQSVADHDLLDLPRCQVHDGGQGQIAQDIERASSQWRFRL